MAIFWTKRLTLKIDFGKNINLIKKLNWIRDLLWDNYFPFCYHKHCFGSHLEACMHWSLGTIVKVQFVGSVSVWCWSKQINILIYTFIFFWKEKTWKLNYTVWCATLSNKIYNEHCNLTMACNGYQFFSRASVFFFSS